MSEPPFSFYEFFAGGGMARIGLGDAWHCAFANDFDPVKAATYRANFPDAAEHLVEGDVWALTAADLPGRADLAWASSPCQDFSLAGARAGLAGSRSGALLGFWALIEALAAQDRAPRLVVIENVVGMLTSHGGADFSALCQALADQGYAFGALEIDGAAFTPQSRPRVFVVATRGPVQALQGPSPFQTPAIRAAHARLPLALQKRWVWWGLAAPSERNTALADLLEPDAACRWRSEGETAALLAHMDANHRGKVEAAAREGGRKIGAVYRRIRSGVQRAEVRFDGLAGCLRTPKGGSSRQLLLIVEGGSVRSRWLAAREGARLMGLPETYRLPPSQSAGLMVVGDGVCAPAVRHLAQRLLAPLLAPAEIMAAE